MSINRIQKLLFSEYCDFEDMVLVESPFAQTTRDGYGVRQVHLGLTPTKLVLATDKLPLSKNISVFYQPGIDPEIETLELISIYPIECVNLSVFHRRKRQSIKARFCNNKVLYFELGGFEKRNMFWNLWCEKIKFLTPNGACSSHSETSVATSTSNSTLYLISSKRYLNQTGNSQLWCKYASGDFVRDAPPKWTDKYLYLGKQMDESPLNYKPSSKPMGIDDFVSNVDCCESRKSQTYTNETTPSNVCNTQINRFSIGVRENCSANLLLPVDPSKQLSNYTTDSNMDMNSCQKDIIAGFEQDINELAEDSVRLWEFNKISLSEISQRGRHRRRYALTPQPHFFHGLGPWNVNHGERFSLQIKRAMSVVNIKRQPIEPELRLTVSKRQLIASISCDTLYTNKRLNNCNNNTIRIPPKHPVIFFWTPEYWYRPRTARDAYQELQNHLQKIRHYHQIKDTFRLKFNRRKISRKYKNSEHRLSSFSSDSEENFEEKYEHNKPKTFSNKMKHLIDLTDLGCNKKETHETSLQTLKRILRMDVALSAWDFDSNTLAYQLTLIDRELFAKITPSELGILVWQQSSKNAPNLGALIAFSHRISCLVATEILRDESDKIRARLVARFINTADKCNKISNFHSCRSLLCGLQSPPVYRLYSLWTYIRKRHSSKYQTFEKLCRLYRDPRLATYQHAFAQASRTAPYLPFIGDLIEHLLDRIPDYNQMPTNSLGIKVSVKPKSLNIYHNERKTNSSFLKKILSSLRMWPTEVLDPQESDETIIIENHMDAYCELDDYYKPLHCFEDNRQCCLDECVNLLEKYQRAGANYLFTKNELARDYLLKARYREDRENFIYSFNIEQPLQYEQ